MAVVSTPFVVDDYSATEVEPTVANGCYTDNDCGMADVLTAVNEYLADDSYNVAKDETFDNLHLYH